MTQSPGVRYARHPEVLWRSTSGGPILLPPGEQEFVRLAGAAALVWEVLDLPLDVPGIRDEVAAITEAVDGVEDAVGELSGRDLLMSGA